MRQAELSSLVEIISEFICLDPVKIQKVLIMAKNYLQTGEVSDLSDDTLLKQTFTLIILPKLEMMKQDCERKSKIGKQNAQRRWNSKKDAVVCNNMQLHPSTVEDVYISSTVDADANNSILPVVHQNIPDELQELKQWVTWKYENSSKNNRSQKVPYNIKNGKRASVTDCTTWSKFDDVILAVSSGKVYDGIGFVFTSNDSYIGIDFDNCILSDNTIDKSVQEIVDKLNSYAEITPSGHGLHIITKGNLHGNSISFFLHI